MSVHLKDGPSEGQTLLDAEDLAQNVFFILRLTLTLIWSHVFKLILKVVVYSMSECKWFNVYVKYHNIHTDAQYKYR